MDRQRFFPNRQAEAKGVWGIQGMHLLAQKLMKLPKNATRICLQYQGQADIAARRACDRCSLGNEARSPILLSSTETPEHWRQVN